MLIKPVELATVKTEAGHRPEGLARGTGLRDCSDERTLSKRADVVSPSGSVRAGPWTRGPYSSAALPG